MATCYSVLSSAGNMVTGFFCFLVALGDWSQPADAIREFKSEDILSIIDNGCLFVGIHPVGTKVLDLLAGVEEAFSSEPGISVGYLNTDNFRWPMGETLEWKTRSTPGLSLPRPDLAVFRKRHMDRTCLSKPPVTPLPKLEAYYGLQTLEILVSWLNSVCSTFRNPDGELSGAGLERQSILENLFRVQSVTESNMSVIYSTKENPLNQSYVWNRHQRFDCDVDVEASHCSANNWKGKEGPSVLPTCQVIEHSVTKEEFLSLYLKKSQPVIFKKSIMHWPAFKKWTNEFFKLQHGDRRVHIKLTPAGDFEGVESADLWDDFKTFKIPEEIVKQLKYPDLVVVRPAHEDMLMSEFIDLINKTAFQSNRNISAYLEYSSIRDIVEHLENDVLEPDLMKDVLKLQHMNIWLSDGNTLGRLHFDPFDNLLCQVHRRLSPSFIFHKCEKLRNCPVSFQISGKKQVTLFEPFDNTKMYEAHIPQATLNFDKASGKFRRRGLEDTTSMVMSPVDLLSPDFEVKTATPILTNVCNCTTQSQIWNQVAHKTRLHPTSVLVIQVVSVAF